MDAGAPGEVEMQQTRSAFLRLQSITLKELTAVMKTLEDDFIQAKLNRSKEQVLLHVDNMAVFYIINITVSTSPKLMSELRRLHQILQMMKITVQATWIPSAVNQYADRLGRTCNTRDLSATPSLIASLAKSLQLQTVHRHWPLKDSPAARQKVMKAQFDESWNDGVSRLWNPPPEWINLALLKIQKEVAHGVIIVPHWTGAPWYKLLQRICISFRILQPGSVALLASESANPA